MAKIFDIQDWLKNNPNRNNFDLTHKVHGSYKFGYWYPFLCKPVVPTDSFHIETAVSTRFMPMPFPTQSNMRLIFHYHFVRMKNIWPNFENWIMGLEEHTPPYLNLPHTFYKDGTLADYLGVQTSFHTSASSRSITPSLRVTSSIAPSSATLSAMTSCFAKIRNLSSSRSVYLPTSDSDYFSLQSQTFIDTLPDTYMRVYVSRNAIAGMQYIPQSVTITNFRPDYVHWGNPINPEIAFAGVYSTDGSAKLLPFTISVDGSNVCSLTLNDSFDTLQYRDVSDYSNFVFAIFLPVRSGVSGTDVQSSVGNIYTPYKMDATTAFTIDLPARSVEIGNDDVSHCPYSCSDTADGDTNVVKVSALPFRAYESICRAYYQNTQGVQPFVVDGVTKYNQWNTTTDDGADSTNYELFKRNWELDAYTSCLLTPQQLPVFVGLTNVSSLGNMRLETPDGQEASVRLADGDNPQAVEYSNLQAETPEARRYALNVASLGFTIPEFREANSLQRWLEMNIRKGYRYKDFIEGHFGKSPKYSELDMPEFLGGFTQKVSVNDISNTNGGTDPSDISGTLGAIAGQARAIGGSKHGVNHYFDDYGFVVGVFCIVPDVAYDCLLPKHFNLKSPLDLYFPEFSQTSFQEITYEELTPAQRKYDGNSLASSFGYQRPNHDLVWYPDTVHGRFRDASGIGNSVVCRRFSSAPQLSSEFLQIDPQSADTIFSYTLGDEDICLGEIVIGISAKRPIPRLFNPSIS